MAEPREDNHTQQPDGEGGDLRAAYAWAKQAFTEEDLRRFTEEEEGIPLAQVLAEIEETERKGQLKRA
jgi:hypothetical protein